MSLPNTYKSFRRTEGAEPLTIEPATETLPRDLQAHDVVVKVHAVSLNFRDVAMMNGRYFNTVVPKGIAASDCAGEVVAVGPAVRRFKVGDRATANFFANYLDGAEPEALLGFGGEVDGVLREFAVFEEQQLVHVPAHLSFEEASTIACAGVTAWNALDGLGGLSEKSAALLEGTGGVSLFALVLLVSLGVKTIITSSSDAKIAKLKKLSPLVEGINYKTQSDVAGEVRRLTDGRGVDVVVNTAGVQSIPSNIASLASHGTISMIGFLDGMEGSWNPSALMGLLFKRAKIRGFYVGSRLDFEALNRFLEEKKIRLNGLIDERVFGFDDSAEAFEYLYAGKHVGKVVIKL